jgi:hypothetical protein
LKLLYEVKQRLTRSAFLTRWLFGVHAPALADGNRCFDLTTLALQREARRRIARGARVLDMGTGTTAVLGIWIERELGSTV